MMRHNYCVALRSITTKTCYCLCYCLWAIWNVIVNREEAEEGKQAYRDSTIIIISITIRK